LPWADVLGERVEKVAAGVTIIVVKARDRLIHSTT
jgi:hypothetical protein